VRVDDSDERIFGQESNADGRVQGGCGLSRCAVAGQQAHDHRESVAGDVQEVAFVDDRAVRQPGSAHAATIQEHGESALDELGAEPEGRLGEPGQQAHSIVVDGPPGGVIAAPAADLRAQLFGDAALPAAAVEVLQDLAEMVALVGDELGRRLGAGDSAER